MTNEITYLKKEQEKAKKKAEKADKAKKNETEEDNKETKESNEPSFVPDAPIPTPKVKVSIELSRSGYLQVTTAKIGNHFVNIEY